MYQCNASCCLRGLYFSFAYADSAPSLCVYPLLVTDVLRSMFNYLYDEDIASDDTFFRWETSGREDLEGRGVALMSASSFLEWLKSTGEGDGEGTGQ